MLRALKRLAVRIGNRGAYLLFLALLDFIYGFGLLINPNPLYAHVHFIPPLTVWAIAWIVVGFVCLVQAFATLDRLAYTMAVTLKFLWGMFMLLSWTLTSTNPFGWISATIFLSFGILTAIVSHWSEQRRLDVGDE